MSAIAGRNAGLPLSDDAGPAVIYPAQSITTLISRAWNLLRLNLKSSLILMLIPTLLLTLFVVLISIPASQTFLTPTFTAQLTLKIILVLLGLGAGVLYFFAWGYTSCALVRLYYSAIVLGAPISVKEALGFVGRAWKPLVVLMLVLGALTTVLVVVDFIILFVGILMSGAAFAALGTFAAVAHNPLMALMMVLFLLVWGFLVILILVSLSTMQGFFFVFPFVAVSTAPEQTTLPWGRRVMYAYKLLLANMPRAVLFAIAVFFFAMVVAMTLNGPMILWVWLEMTRLGVSEQHHVPLYVHIVTNLWQNLVQLLLMPFYISAVTLFWYDCRVRKEGLDLRIWFDNIVRRRGGDPQLFGVE